MYGLISPKARVAAIYNDARVNIHNCGGEYLFSMSRNEAEKQFFAFDDVLEIKNASEAQIIARLAFENKKIETLYLLLTVLDLSIDDNAKLKIKAFLESTLADSNLTYHLNRTLYSCPLPNNFEDYQELLLNLQKFPLLEGIIENLLRSQAKIKLVLSTWKSEFLNKVSDLDHELAINVLTHTGLAFEISNVEVGQKAISQVRFLLLSKLSQILNSRQLISNFFKALDVNVSVSDVKPVIVKEIDTQKGFYVQKPVEKNHRLYLKAQSEMEKIKRLLSEGDTQKAIKYTDELVKRQVESGGKEFASKSLCSLAEHAKCLEEFSLMLNWAQRAHDINPDDSRPSAQIGDAYLLLQDFERARFHFDKYRQWGGEAESYGLAGLARIYRAKHDYETALSFIERSIDIDPLDTIHLSTHAEILADLGRFEDAENLYRKLCLSYPDKVAVQCGLAAMLSEQRKIEQAEQLYRDSVQLWPKAQIPRTALGFLLARQGKFIEAHKFLDEGIKLCPFDSFIPVNSKATALKMEARYAEATTLLSTYINKHPHNIDPYVSLIDTMVCNGEAKEALIICDSYISERGSSDLILRAKASVLRKLGKLTEALRIVDEVASRHPKWPQILCDKADLLRNLGLNDEARNYYECALRIHQFERRAKNGIRLVNALTHTVADTPTMEIGTPKTYDDWEDISIKGLVLLSQRDYIGAQAIFTSCENKSPFKTINEKMRIPFAASDIGLKQYDVALQKVGALTSQLAVVQKIIICCQLKNFTEARSLIDDSKKSGVATQDVIPLIERLCLGNELASNDSLYELLDVHVSAILKVA